VPGGFPETRHSAISGLHSDDAERRARCWDAVAAAYWEPVCKYVRLRWRSSPEDAEEITQAFFARAIEKEFFEGYDAARASFRTYLRACLDRFVLNERKSANRLKRAGGATLLSLDDSTEEPRAPGEDYEAFFHQEWIRSLFRSAVETLRTECAGRGREIPFRVFERYDLAENDRRPTYGELAAEFDVTPASVTNYLAAMRRDLRRIVLDQLRDLTATDREFRAEARAALGIDPED
jgi:RNA polymerase sigma factor (sigma-70 family)